MTDLELTRIRDFLKSKLIDYLRAKGINPDVKFACLNPNHRGDIASMGYNSDDLSVSCPICQARYDLFELIGVDYNLQDHRDRFAKVHELFLGPVPPMLHDRLYKPVNATQSNVGFSVVSVEVQDNAKLKPVNLSPLKNNFVPVNPARFISPQSRSNELGAHLNAHASTPLDKQGAAYSRLTAQPSNISISPLSSRPGFDSHERHDLVIDQQNYYANCHAVVEKCSLFKQRGISADVIERFKLGYDEHFVAGNDQLGMQQVWQAAIIPISTNCFMARNLNPQATGQERMRKKGNVSFLNSQCLEQAQTIFVTEGEFDCLSLESLGYSSICLGGVGNVRLFLDLISSKREHKSFFYLCLDNDTQGQEAEQLLASGMTQLGIAHQRINLCYPFKDINQALCQQPQQLKKRLENLNQLLQFKLEPTFAPQQRMLIKQADDFKYLYKQQGIYALSAQSKALYRLLTLFIKDEQNKVVYAGKAERWQQICDLLAETYIKSNEYNASFLRLNFNQFNSQLSQALEALKLQKIDDFNLIVDFSCCAQHIEQYLSELEELCTKSQCAVLVLVNSDQEELIQNYSVQLLKLSADLHGELRFESRGLTTESILFKMLYL